VGGDPVNRADPSGLDWEYVADGGGVVEGLWDTETAGGWRYKPNTPTRVPKPRDDVTPAQLGLAGNVFTDADFRNGAATVGWDYRSMLEFPEFAAGTFAYGPASNRQTLAYPRIGDAEANWAMAAHGAAVADSIHQTAMLPVVIVTEPYHQIQDTTKVVGAWKMGVPTQYLDLHSGMAAGAQVAVDQNRVASFVTKQAVLNGLIVAGPPALAAVGTRIEAWSLARAETAAIQQMAARDALAAMSPANAQIVMGNGTVALHHGTSAAGAASIRAAGVDLSFSRSALDFGPGFYTTTDLAQAQAWAARSGGELVSFALPEAELAGLRVMGVPAGGAWTALVRAGRAGGTLQGIDVMSGPMLLNPRAYLSGAAGPRIGGQQTVFLTQDAADILSQYLTR